MSLPGKALPGYRLLAPPALFKPVELPRSRASSLLRTCFVTAEHVMTRATATLSTCSTSLLPFMGGAVGIDGGSVGIYGRSADIYGGNANGIVGCRGFMPGNNFIFSSCTPP
eukprot:1122844-Rhodomonas_salina.1